MTSRFYQYYNPNGSIASIHSIYTVASIDTITRHPQDRQQPPNQMATKNN